MELRNEFTNARDAKFVQLLRSRIENQPSDSLADIGKIVPAAIGYFFQGIGRFMLMLLRFFQEFAIAGLIAVSPLLIGFLFFSYTQSLGVQFGVTSLTVLLWHVAICLVDIAIQVISDTLFLPITAGGISYRTAQNMIVVQNWLLFPFIMAFATFITVFFYLSVPVRRGRDHEGTQRDDRDVAGGRSRLDASRGTDGGRGTHRGGSRGHLGRFRRRPGGHRRNKDSGGRRERRGTHCQRPCGSGGSAPARRLRGGGSDLPEPPRLAPATVGESYKNPSNPAQVAHQTARIRSP